MSRKIAVFGGSSQPGGVKENASWHWHA